MPSVIGVFKECIDIAKNNYLKLLGLYILVVLAFAVALFGILLATGTAHGVVSGISSPMAAIPLVLTIFIAAILISPIWNGIYYSLALQGMKKRGKTSLDKAFGDSRKAYRKLLWTSVIQTVIIVVILGIIILPDLFYILPVKSGASSITSHPLHLLSAFGITSFVFIVVAAALGALFFVAVPLAMLDGTSGINAIKKSFEVARKHFWSIIGLLILTGMAYVVAYVVIEIAAVAVSAVNHILAEVISLVLTVLIESFVVGVVGFLPIAFYKRYVRSSGF